MDDILIFPFSGTAIEALDCLNDNQKCIGFISDDQALIGQQKFGVEIYGRKAFDLFSNAKIIAVNGSPVSFGNRKKIIDGLGVDNKRFTNVVHPKALIGKNVKLGTNTLIMGGVVLTSNVVLGNHVIILPNTVINHDTVVGDYTLISSNNTICGYVSIGESCYIGAGSTIKNNIRVGNNSLVGIGSNVVKDIDKGLVVKGNPAK